MKQDKITRNKLEAFVKFKLENDERWALRALMLVYGQQTASEQASETTEENNGVGFNGCDAEFLTSLAKAYVKHGRLSVKQIEWLKRKIRKYSKQVVRLASPFELVARFAKASKP